jgi:(heptosyl)LPS beta-1,4-glucosyltransferase
VYNKAVKISVVINTRNESSNIERAIASIKSFADEIIVVDMESSDDTVKKAKKAGAVVFPHKNTQYVEPARNFAIKKATGDWIFILDADEEVQPALVKELKKIAKEGKYHFVRIPRKNIIFGKWMEHARWWPDYNIRFFKKNAVTWDDEIHSIPITVGDGINLEENVSLAIIHHNYQTVEQYLDRLNRYTTVQAAHLIKIKNVTARDFIVRPSSEFLTRYFAGHGYKDGMHGLALSLLQSFSELIVVAKAWQKNDFAETDAPLREVTKALKETQKEINYWSAHAHVEEGGSVVDQVKRKFKLP